MAESEHTTLRAALLTDLGDQLSDAVAVLEALQLALVEEAGGTADMESERRLAGIAQAKVEAAIALLEA